MKKRQICVASGTRAEYGLLSGLMHDIQLDSGLGLQIIATCMHLSPEFGLTYKEIEDDGFSIDAKVEMLLSSDTAVGIAKSMGLGVIGIADALNRLKPDILVLLGDRYETLAAAQVALVMRIPVAHIGGGDLTVGSFDEAIRHSITKMAHLHFVTNEDSARTVRQLGERPEHVYTVGSLGLDNIAKLRKLDRDALSEALDYKFLEKNLLVTFHPPTLDDSTASDQFLELLQALDELGPEVGIIFTKSNADPESRRLAEMVDEYVATRGHTKGYASLGVEQYLSAIAAVDVVVGNSSSGLYEVPSFKKPTVNIGDRQQGRIAASSVLGCKPVRAEIAKTILEAFSKDCSDAVNPFGDGHTSARIIEILKEANLDGLIKKEFFKRDCQN